MLPEEKLVDVKPVDAKAWFDVNVSRETFARLERYAEMLVEWNQKFNLVSASTIPTMWSRHFMDSAQLMGFAPHEAKVFVDMGSGAGFPGLVLSILGAPEMHLIESTGKKVNFLRAVIDELKLKATVHQKRIEDVRDIKADIITARALGSLDELFRMAQNKLKTETICLFLKGRSVAEELTESQKKWKFVFDKSASISDPSGSVLVIKNLEYINRGKNGKR